MRVISESAGLLIMFLYIMVTYFVWRAIHSLIRSWPKPYRLIISSIYFLSGFLLMTGFCYIILVRPDGAVPWYFSFYCWVNALILTDFIWKVPLFLSSVIIILMNHHRHNNVILKAALIISAGLALLFSTGMFLSTRTIKTHRVDLSFPDLPPAFDGLRIFQFSDSHLGSSDMKLFLKKVHAEVMVFRPDLIFFTGDLVNNYSDEANSYIADFKEFKSSMGNYAVLGNHDYGDYSLWSDPALKSRNFSGITEVYSKSGFYLLRNNSVKVKKESDSIFLAGVENWGLPYLPHYSDLAKTVKELPESTFCIMLSHDPASWDSIKCLNRVIPLTLSGHTHGFQWGVYFAGIEFNLLKSIQKYWGGLYRQNDRFLYVNRGIGMVGMHLRVDMPAEMTLITLKSSKIHR